MGISAHFKRGVQIFRNDGLGVLIARSWDYLLEDVLSRDYWVKRYIWRTSESHTEAYRRWMDYKIRQTDAREAVGGVDHDIGRLQFEFLKERGLEPSDRFLDIGCGSLRGGEYYIEYLDPGNYTGTDVNHTVITEGKAELPDSLLEEKQPSFNMNDDLRFDEFDGVFDVLIAQSVFTHLPEEDIQECFANVSKVMHEESAFYWTYLEGESIPSTTLYQYTRTELAEMAQNVGLEIEFFPPESYPHPRGQQMAVVRIEGP